MGRKWVALRTVNSVRVYLKFRSLLRSSSVKYMKTSIGLCCSQCNTIHPRKKGGDSSCRRLAHPTVEPVVSFQRSANAVFLLWVRTDFGKPQTGGLGGDPPAGGPGAGAPGKILRIGAQIVAFRKGIQGHQCLHVILCTGESHSPSRLQSCTATLSLSQPATARQG